MSNLVFLILMTLMSFVDKDDSMLGLINENKKFRIEVIYATKDSSSIEVQLMLYKTPQFSFYTDKRFMIKIITQPESVHEIWEGKWSKKNKMYILEFKSVVPSEIKKLFANELEFKTIRLENENLISFPKSTNGIWIYGVYCERKLRISKNYQDAN